jgi:hypothetical protein
VSPSRSISKARTFSDSSGISVAPGKITTVGLGADVGILAHGT